ncbi:unnamed protein product [Ambrosiozyma monospora]|uniref:Unnamed protein product n=1 Tax=Ambrosiozyma monospora TaxID=43982 RepID=A0A9W6Z1W9_AMBMO|nr:unnamed protein product [Ambrosiozyma monospora]
MHTKQVSYCYQPPVINVVCQFKLDQFIKDVPILHDISEFGEYWKVLSENMAEHNFSDPVSMLRRQDPKEIANCLLTYEKTMANLLYRTTWPKYHYLFNKYADYSSPTMCMLLELKVVYLEWLGSQFEAKMMKLKQKQKQQEEVMNSYSYEAVPFSYQREVEYTQLHAST